MIFKTGAPDTGGAAHDAIIARGAIEDAGGLCSITDLARRWGISRQRARVIVRMDGFPEPVLTDGASELWFADEADAFRHRRMLETR